jgi:hypothetical protein
MTDFAQTSVSILTNMFSTLRIPVQFASVTFCSFVLTSETSGAWLPTAGNSPIVQ